MVIKKYVSDTEKDAILLAKNDLGNEAIVMNIRKIQPKGILSVFMKSKVEVTAAIDEGSSSTVTPSLPEKRSLAPNQNTLEALEKAMKHGSLKEENSPYDNVEQIEKKIDHLQNSLQDLIESKIQSHIEGHEGEVFNKDSENKGELAGKQKSTRIESCKKLIKDQLVNAEMISEYADEIIQEIDDNVKSDTSINAMQIGRAHV